MTDPDPRPGAEPGAAATWAHLVLSALALLYVLAAPFSVFIAPEAVQPWYAGVAGLTCLSAVLVATTGKLGCLELFVPMVSTISVLAFTAARPDVIGPWIPVVQLAGVVALVAAYRWRPRRSGRNQRLPVRKPLDRRHRRPYA